MKRQRDGIDVCGKRPYFEFYVADYERDVQMLSLAAQGLWARMLCWMHHAPDRGYLELPTGAPMEVRDVASRVGKSEADVADAISEMERIGLFSRDSRGCIFCRRMKRDAEISLKRKEAAKTRANDAGRSGDGRFAPANHQQTVQQSADSGTSKLPTAAPASGPAKAEQKSDPSLSFSFSSPEEEERGSGDNSDSETEQPVSGITVKFDAATGAEEFLSAYPVQVQTDLACQWYLSEASKSIDAAAYHQSVMDGLNRWLRSVKWLETDGTLKRQYIPSPAKFLGCPLKPGEMPSRMYLDTPPEHPRFRKTAVARASEPQGSSQPPKGLTPAEYDAMYGSGWYETVGQFVGLRARLS